MSYATKLIAAYTPPGGTYPPYINVSELEDGSVRITLRGDPKEFDGVYVCGYVEEPGRCVPGKANCNNYCNLAPQLGPMQNAPKTCRHVECGATVSMTISKAEWEELKKNFG